MKKISILIFLVGLIIFPKQGISNITNLGSKSIMLTGNIPKESNVLWLKNRFLNFSDEDKPSMNPYQKKAIIYRSIGIAMTASGTALMGYALIKSYSKNEKLNVQLFSIGLGSVLLSTLFHHQAWRNRQKAKYGYVPRSEVGLMNGGIGLRIRI